MNEGPGTTGDASNGSRVAQPYTGIYGMHKYWSKKPHNTIRDLIAQHTSPGDIVLDPFCGSGIAVSEAIFTGRKAIGIDINPIAIFITRQLVTDVPADAIEDAFQQIRAILKPRVDELYAVRRDGKVHAGTHFVWAGDTLLEIWYRDGGRKRIVNPTRDDIQTATAITLDKITHFYPRDRLFANSRVCAKPGDRVHDLFTPRNLLALSLIMDGITKVEDRQVQDALKLCFTSCVGQASKMVFVITSRGKMSGAGAGVGTGTARARKDVGSWVIGYWVPKQNFEINAWNCFENRCKKIIKARRQQPRGSIPAREVDSFGEMHGGNVMVKNEPSQRFLHEIPDGSIDYVITDPPHGDRQPYLELSMMWNAWLKLDVNYDDEIVVSNSSERAKNREQYATLIHAVFRHVERVLKAGHHFTLIFNSLDDETWRNLFSFFSTSTFEIIAVEGLEYSANSVVQDSRKGALKSDIIFTFEKKTSSTKPQARVLTREEARTHVMNEIQACHEKGNANVHLERFRRTLLLDMLKRNIYFDLSCVIEIASHGGLAN